MTSRSADLGSLELLVLKVLWDRGPSAVRDVQAELESQGRPLAYTTVQTLLTRLEQKRFVVADKSGHAFVFRARLTRDRVKASRLDALLDQLYDGAAGALVLQLVRSERLTGEEIAELQRLVQELDASNRRGGQSPGRP